MQAKVLRGPQPQGATQKDICGCQQAMRAAAQAVEFSNTHLSNLASVELQEDSKRVEPIRVTQVMSHLPYGVGVRFSHPGGIDSFIFEVFQNGISVRHPQAIRNNCRATSFLHKNELNLQNETDDIEFKIYAQVGNVKSPVVSVKTPFKTKKLKQDNYKFSYIFNNEYSIDGQTGELVFDGGFTQEEMETIDYDFALSENHYVKRFRNPASNIPFSITRYLNSNVAFKIPEAFELRIHPAVRSDADGVLKPYTPEDENRIRLNGHEFGHGWWCPPNLSIDEFWNYNQWNSWAEEGLAEMESRLISGTMPWYSDIYDVYNTEQLRMDSFWKMAGGMGEQFIMYGCSAMAWWKLNESNQYIIPRFWDVITSRLNNDQSLSIDHALIKKCLIIAAQGTKVEGLDFEEWFNRQHVFHPQRGEGLRMFTNIAYNFYSQETIAQIQVFFYEDEIGWFSYDEDSNLLQHKVNGLGTVLRLVNLQNVKLEYFEPLIKTSPANNPPEGNRVASIKLIITTGKEDGTSFTDSAHYDEFQRLKLQEQLSHYRLYFEVKHDNITSPLSFDFTFGKIENKNWGIVGLEGTGIEKLENLSGGMVLVKDLGHTYKRFVPGGESPQLVMFKQGEGIKEEQGKSELLNALREVIRIHK